MTGTTAKLVPNIIVSVAGDPKVGKTHLALSFPDPIKVFSFDMGARYVASKFKDKKIELAEYTLPIAEKAMRDVDDPIIYEPIWDAFYTEFKEDVHSGKYKTVVIDTATAVWTLIGQSETERKGRKKIQRIEYSQPNLLMQSLYQHAAVSGVNLVATHYLKDRYVNDQNTGERVLAGWGQTEGLVDLVLKMKLQTTPGERKGTFVTKTITTIEGCRFDNHTLTGISLEDATYDDIMIVLGV